MFTVPGTSVQQRSLAFMFNVFLTIRNYTHVKFRYLPICLPRAPSTVYLSVDRAALYVNTKQPFAKYCYAPDILNS